MDKERFETEINERLKILLNRTLLLAKYPCDSPTAAEIAVYMASDLGRIDQICAAFFSTPEE